LERLSSAHTPKHPPRKAASETPTGNGPHCTSSWPR
jgi:hypothetical protein